MKIKIDPLDVLFSKVIRTRAKGKCEYCLKPKEFKELQTSHFHGRRKKSVRWDLDNAAGICFYCHRILTENPLEHTDWFKNRLGEKKFNDLNIRANIRLGMPDKKLVKIMLENELKRIT